MTAEEFVRELDARNQTVLKRLDPEATLKPGTDGCTLTGDANLIHSRWAVRYTISDPETFAFGWHDAVQVLHDEFDRAILASSKL